MTFLELTFPISIGSPSLLRRDLCVSRVSWPDLRLALVFEVCLVRLSWLTNVAENLTGAGTDLSLIGDQIHIGSVATAEQWQQWSRIHCPFARGAHLEAQLRGEGGLKSYRGSDFQSHSSGGEVG